ncbi:MAG TPA: DUF4342 domain-containing protein [Ktedonobacterales bacterium]|nr:DUF4342 domain-containing protein [Ktedonobacterales bacterium]
MTHPNSATVENEPQSGKHEEWQVSGAELAAKVNEILHEGNVRRIIIKHEGQIVFEIPLTFGVVGTLLAPWLAALGAIGALLAHCTIEIVRTDEPAKP